MTNSLENIKWYQRELDQTFTHLRKCFPGRPILVISVADRGGRTAAGEPDGPGGRCRLRRLRFPVWMRAWRGTTPVRCHQSEKLSRAVRKVWLLAFRPEGTCHPRTVRPAAPDEGEAR